MAKIVTRQEVKHRRMKFQVFAGMFDFLGILAGLVVIVVCIVLINSLFHWAVKDAEVSFKTLWDLFTSAIIIPE